MDLNLTRQEYITELAAAENVIIISTIHQPSSDVYDGFDQVMILSKGREAFCGDKADTIEYFKSVGYPMPEHTNPAEFFLKIVNSDFVSDEAVEGILDAWKKKKAELPAIEAEAAATKTGESAEALAEYVPPSSMFAQIGIMLRRHGLLVVRDPVIYIGRALIFLMSNIYFAIVYLKAREHVQSQVANRMWLVIWFMGVPANMGVRACVCGCVPMLLLHCCSASSCCMR